MPVAGHRKRAETAHILPAKLHARPQFIEPQAARIHHQIPGHVHGRGEHQAAAQHEKNEYPHLRPRSRSRCGKQDYDPKDGHAAGRGCLQQVRGERIALAVFHVRFLLSCRWHGGLNAKRRPPVVFVGEMRKSFAQRPQRTPITRRQTAMNVWLSVSALRKSPRVTAHSSPSPSGPTRALAFSISPTRSQRSCVHGRGQYSSRALRMPLLYSRHRLRAPPWRK